MTLIELLKNLPPLATVQFSRRGKLGHEFIDVSVIDDRLKLKVSFTCSPELINDADSIVVESMVGDMIEEAFAKLKIDFHLH